MFGCRTDNNRVIISFYQKLWIVLPARAVPTVLLQKKGNTSTTIGCSVNRMLRSSAYVSSPMVKFLPLFRCFARSSRALMSILNGMLSFSPVSHQTKRFSNRNQWNQWNQWKGIRTINCFSLLQFENSFSKWSIAISMFGAVHIGAT